TARARCGLFPAGRARRRRAGRSRRRRPTRRGIPSESDRGRRLCRSCVLPTSRGWREARCFLRGQTPRPARGWGLASWRSHGQDRAVDFPDVIDAEEIPLRRWRPDDAKELAAAVQASLPELLPFMPWAHEGYDVGAAGIFID